jgi:hypothetical protein
MDRKTRLTLKIKARGFETENIVEGIIKTLALLVMSPKSPRFKRRCQQIHILKNEVKSRGFIIVKHITPFGMALEIIPNQTIALALPDYHAMAPCSMEIPSITDLLAAPLPSDLPKHGYLKVG